MRLDRADQLGGQLGLPIAVQRDHAAGQRVPLLRPLAGAIPEVDHLGEPGAALVDLAAVHQQPARLGAGEGAHPPVAGRLGEPVGRDERLERRSIVAAGREALRDRGRGQVGGAAGRSRHRVRPRDVALRLRRYAPIELSATDAM